MIEKHVDDDPRVMPVCRKAVARLTHRRMTVSKTVHRAMMPDAAGERIRCIRGKNASDEVTSQSSGPEGGVAACKKKMSEIVH